MKTDLHFWSYLAHFFSEREMFQTKVVEIIKTHILCSVIQKSWLYQIMWKNTVECGRPPSEWGASGPLGRGGLCATNRKLIHGRWNISTCMMVCYFTVVVSHLLFCC